MRCNRFLLAYFAVFILLAPRTFAADWQVGDWRIDISGTGTPGSGNAPVYYPGGMKYGNALMVYHRTEGDHFPQMWVFLSDGFFRQVSPSNTFGTSYRLFRYWSSAGEACENPRAEAFTVVGTNENDELEIRLLYTNNAVSGDRFNVSATVWLEPPRAAQAAMRMDVAVTNASGRAVPPATPMHRALGNQWTLLAISSMYVADHLSGGLPDWYDDLDPLHRYTGALYDGDFFNDGFSQNGRFRVSTHDIRDISFQQKDIRLAHDAETCPYVSVPDYGWYTDLVALYETSTSVRVAHAYDSAKTHELVLSECSGLVSDLNAMNWAASYYRQDANMVDGDNIQVKLSLDNAIETWPVNGVQRVSLRFTAGTTNAAVVQYPCAVRILPDNTNLTDLAEWRTNGDSPYPSAAIAALTPGIHTVTVNEVEGWVKPREPSVIRIPSASLWGPSMEYAVFPDVPLPVNLSAIALTESVILRWPDPNTCGYSNQNVLVRASTETYPESTNEGRLVYQGPALSCSDTGRTPGITLYYTLWISDDGESFRQPVE